MKCPHCLENFFPYYRQDQLIAGTGTGQGDTAGLDVNERGFKSHTTQCPSCKQFVIFLQRYNKDGVGLDRVQVWPKGVARSPLGKDVPVEFAVDYLEACLVLNDSPKASAALSRRCLQHVLDQHAGVKGDLVQQIQQVIDSKSLPGHLADAIDAVRNIGNFAAHPIKSKSTGEIVEVEPGEAEWLLDTLEGLFDFYFVQPAVLKAKRKALNEKLADVGKRPVK